MNNLVCCINMYILSFQLGVGGDWQGSTCYHTSASTTCILTMDAVQSCARLQTPNVSQKGESNVA